MILYESDLFDHPLRLLDYYVMGKRVVKYFSSYIILNLIYS
jgi:hypothetical protein